jgi:hypothetical protein
MTKDGVDMWSQTRLCVLSSCVFLFCATVVLTAQVDRATTDDVTIYQVVLRHPEVSGRGAELVAITLLSETAGPGLSERQLRLIQAPQEVIEALIQGTTNSKELPLELAQEPGVTVQRREQMGSCLATVEELRQRSIRDPRPRMFLSRIAYSTDHQTAAVAMASCGGGRLVLLNHTRGTWSIVGGLAVWDH